LSREDQKGVALKTDSLELKLKGIASKQINLLEVSLEDVPDIAKRSLNALLKQNLPDSKSGYLKINFTEMLKPERLTGIIYLMGDFPTLASYVLDSAALKDISEIISFSFMSKEEAKKKYLADGGDDWDKVLKENPLPNSLEIVLEKKDWTEESLKELKNKIHEKLIMESEIIFPDIWVKKSDDYFFFEYKRK
jgi:hypothetical protein